MERPSIDVNPRLFGTVEMSRCRRGMDRQAGLDTMDANARVRGFELSERVRARRRYDGTLRRQQAAETRERIVAAGSELLHGSPIRDWRALTVRAVAERAGVNQRTV